MKRVTKVAKVPKPPTREDIEQFLFSRGWRNEYGAEGVGASLVCWTKFPYPLLTMTDAFATELEEG